MSIEVVSRALDKYNRHVERSTRKILHRLYLDETRRSMYCELREGYDRHLACARSRGIDPLSKGFEPSSARDAPPELSQWLHLFHAYLQIEQKYADALEALGRSEPRLVDPPAHKLLQEELQECWNLMLYGNEKGEDRLSHKEIWNPRTKREPLLVLRPL